MINKQTETENFNTSSLIFFLVKWRKLLLVVFTATIIISSFTALLIREKYKSTVILFPATTSSISKALLTENNFKQDDVMQLGAEEEAEQMLQILNSDEIRTKICEKYNLMKHYKIDSSDKFKRTKLFEEFQSNINFKRTEYMSVKIEVLDQNPDTAAMIANDIAALHDSTKIRMQKQRALQALNIVRSEYLLKDADVKKMTDSIRAINRLGVYDYESQSEVTSEQYAIAISKGDARAVKSLEEKLKVLSEYGSAYVSLRDNLFMQRKQLNLLKTKYEEAKVDVEQVIPQKFIVSNAYPAEKKSYPIRWLIVVVSTISALLITILLLLVIENIQQYRKGV
jgi:uncharacterized protein involved in exopolysaccharide biosynthesis